MLNNNNLININQNVFDDIIKNEVERLVKLQMDDFEKKLSENYYFDDRLLSRKATADKLDISVRTLDDRVSKGKIKSANLGRGVKFRNSDVLEFIKNLK
jgi:excisionase family DNA binding protein